MPADLLERHLVDLWRQQRLPATGLRTEDGEEVRIIYPGRPGGGAGPDFTDAVIECGHRRLAVDVELHMRSSQWQQHGHQRDPAYNRVGLHVVLETDSAAPTRRRDGQAVPVLVVGRYLRPAPRRLSANPTGRCPGARRSPRAIGRRLDQAGDDRFQIKVARFAAELTHTAPGQVLFEGIMEALGYTRNKAPFRALAQRLPLANLATEPLEAAQAQLFGAAGLLPSQRTISALPLDGDTRRLEALWRAGPNIEPMPPGSWQFMRIRPNNSPLRRMAAMAYLLQRDPPLLARLLAPLSGAPDRGGGARMEAALLVSAGGYWAEHDDFGRRCAPNPALLGRGRAGEIAVNVLLPFAAALEESPAPAVYRAYHRLAANSVQAHMAAQLGIGGGVINSARRQQGLLHLYANFCTRGQCPACVLVS